MRVARSRYGRRTASVAVAVLVVVAGGAGLQAGHATTSTKYYSTTLTPSSVGAGARATETLTLSNSTTSKQTLGSEDVTVPAGYSATAGAVTAPSGKSWTASITSGVIHLRAATSHDALAPGQSVSVVLVVDVPCTPPADGTWATEAKQSNNFNGPPGNDFVRLHGTSDPSLVVVGTCHFVFGAIDPLQTAGRQFAFRVNEADGNGGPTHFTNTATVSATFASTRGAPALTAALAFDSNGVANGTATTYTAELNQWLTVTSGVISNDSGHFDVQPNVAKTLVFDPQAEPTDTVRGATIAAFTVDVFDQWGNPESVPGLNQVPVTLSIANDPYGGTTLGGTTTQTSVAGVATFGDITLNHGGSGFTLLAASGSLATDTSSPFDVFDAICTGSCSATNPAGNTTVLTNGGGVTNPTTIQMSPSGASFTCGATFSAIGSIVTINPAAGFTAANPLSVTLQFAQSVAPGNNTHGFGLCISKDQGLTYREVNNCTDGHHLTDSDLPCISQRRRSSYNGDLVIVLLMTSTDPAAGLH